MNNNFDQFRNSTLARAEQEKKLKNIEFKEFDIQELSEEDSYIELKDDAINKISETVMCFKDILKISQQSKLFKATVNIELLSKFNDGSYSTIIRDSNGHIIAHAGFEQVSPIDFTPLIVFKIASIITSQYYLHNISEQLNHIKEELDFLKRNIYQKTIARLMSIKKEIDIKIKNPNTVDDEFLNALENYRKEIREILFDYQQKFKVEMKKEIESSFFKSNIKNLKEKENDISLYLKIIAICEFLNNVINSLILHIYIKNNRNLSFQKELIEKDMNESTLFNDCDECYDLIFNQIPLLVSTFEKEFSYYKEAGSLLKKSTYKNGKSFLKRISDDFRLKNILEQCKPKALIKNNVNILGAPTLVARKIKKQRESEVNKYIKRFESKKQQIKEIIQNNNKKIEKMIGDRELIYITDNQQNKRLFIKRS